MLCAGKMILGAIPDQKFTVFWKTQLYRMDYLAFSNMSDGVKATCISHLW